MALMGRVTSKNYIEFKIRTGLSHPGDVSHLFNPLSRGQ